MRSGVRAPIVAEEAKIRLPLPLMDPCSEICLISVIWDQGLGTLIPCVPGLSSLLPCVSVYTYCVLRRGVSSLGYVQRLLMCDMKVLLYMLLL